jgi:hypothetical protein
VEDGALAGDHTARVPGRLGGRIDGGGAGAGGIALSGPLRHTGVDLTALAAFGVEMVYGVARIVVTPILVGVLSR